MTPPVPTLSVCRPQLFWRCLETLAPELLDKILKQVSSPRSAYDAMKSSSSSEKVELGFHPHFTAVCNRKDTTFVKFDSSRRQIWLPREAYSIDSLRSQILTAFNLQHPNL